MPDTDSREPFAVTCPTRLLLDQIADRWSMLVLMALADEAQRFNALQRRIEGVSRKVLTQVLRRLEYNGLVLRTVGAGVPAPVTYSTTPLGTSLAGLLNGIRQWSTDNIGLIEAARERQADVVRTISPVGGGNA